VSVTVRRMIVGLLFVTTLVAATTGCEKKRQRYLVEISRLQAREQLKRGQQYLAERDLYRAKQVFQRIQYSNPAERIEIEPLVRLALADSTFYQRKAFNLIDAQSLYQDFVTLYGDHARAPYAQFQNGMCSYKQVINPSRDQTRTRQAISDLKEVERRYPGSPFAGAAGVMVTKAEENLAEHEFTVGRFYMTKKKFSAAAERFRRTLERYPGYTEKDKLYFHLGQALLKGNNSVEARIYLDKLVADYPDGKYIEPARKALAAAGGTLELDMAP
jgi:outer membrane protein assembly factor BamD